MMTTYLLLLISLGNEVKIITKIAEHRHTHSSTIWPPISSFLPSTPLDYQKTID